jgi:sulfur-oxidizing protein SoxB
MAPHQTGTGCLRQQAMVQEDLLKFDSKGQVTLLHVTDMHAQLKPLYFRPPSENYGVGAI